jgi:hypothetical protein
MREASFCDRAAPAMVKDPGYDPPAHDPSRPPTVDDAGELAGQGQAPGFVVLRVGEASFSGPTVDDLPAQGQHLALSPGGVVGEAGDLLAELRETPRDLLELLRLHEPLPGVAELADPREIRDLGNPAVARWGILCRHVEWGSAASSHRYAPAEGLRRWRASLMGEEVVKLLRSA